MSLVRSLFLKIFVSLWLAQAVVGWLVVAVLTSSGYLVSRANQSAAVNRPLTGTLLAHYSRALDQDQNQAAYLKQIQTETGWLPALYDAKGQVIAGTSLDTGDADSQKAAQDLAKQAATSREGEFDFFMGRMVGAHRITLSNGRAGVLMLQYNQGGPPDSIFGIKVGPRKIFEIARWTSIFIVAGLVAFGLARYLTAPTLKLRRATQQLASGDLSTRVGPQMGRRSDELADLGHDFDAMAERIEGLLFSERRLLGDISHELRSPLARLQVALDLADQSADEETRSYLKRIERESGKLNSMIGQLLTLNRLETAQRGTNSAETNSVRTTPVDLTRLVEDICADANFEAQSRGRSVKLLENAKSCVNGDPEILRSAIENVVRNAIVHTPQSSQIEVSHHVQTATAEAIIKVRDHGPGVPPEALDDLFRPFYRVDEARSHQKGAGLGLSITERATHIHGGKVSAINAADGGLLVEIRLPLITAGTPQLAPVKA